MSCPFTNFVNNDKEFQKQRFPIKVMDKSINDLETALKKSGKKPSRFVRKFNLSSDNPIRYSYWPRLLRLTDKTIEDKYRPEVTESYDFSGLLDKSGFEMTDAKLINKYKLNDDGVKAVRYTLNKLSGEKPELVYCPEIWNLCAILIHYHSPDVAMKCLNAILSKEGWIASTKDEWKAKILSLGFYLSSKSKITQVAYFEMFSEWMKAIWDLPFDILVQILDSFMVEGYKIFYRAAIVLCTESSKKFEGKIEFDKIANNIDCHPQAFRDAMFTIKGMSKKKILKCITRSSDFLTKHSASFDHLITPSISGGEMTHSAVLEDAKKDVRTITVTGVEQIISTQDVQYKILSPQEMNNVFQHIEDENIKKICKPNLVFSSDKDGVSMTTLLEKTPNNESLIVIELDTKPHKAVVGAFLYDRLEKKEGFYGRGKTFIFRSRPGDLEIYKWNNDKKDDQSAYRFQRVTNECIEIGAGKETHSAAIDLNDTLSTLKSGPSVIFESPSLLHGLIKEEDKTFDKEETADAKILRVELFSFVQV